MKKKKDFYNKFYFYGKKEFSFFLAIKFVLMKKHYI